MNDLIYFGYEWEDDSSKLESEFISGIKKKFPDVKLTDAFDDIKGYRQQVELPEELEDEYLTWLMGNGWVNLSLNLQLAGADKFKRIFELTKEQYPEAFKEGVV